MTLRATREAIVLECEWWRERRDVLEAIDWTLWTTLR